MNIPLSDRLFSCASFVKIGERVADVGCDHGYLGIYLLENNIAEFVIAADINPMPLKSAKNNAEKYVHAHQMSFHLSDGVKNIPREFDVLVCAGMGADTIISILEDAPWLKSSEYRLILQCQSKTPALRQYLSDNGWSIEKEAVLRDGRFLYTIMEIIWQPNAPRLTAAQSYFPPAILKHPSKTVPEYYKWVINGLRIQVMHQKDKQKLSILNELEQLNVDISNLMEE